MMTTDGLLSWALGIVSTAVGALVATIWKINDRLTKLETKHESVIETVVRIEKKLDRVVERLL